MNARFRAYIEQLPDLLNRLTSAPALTRMELQDEPSQGVYVFYEDNKAIFAGRSDHLKEYLRSQGRPGSDQFTASIAFGFAKQEAADAGYPFTTNAAALGDSMLKAYFAKAKARMAKMLIRVVEVKDPIEQMLLVLYSSLELQTSNQFETH